jgi:hypothetical protein
VVSLVDRATSLRWSLAGLAVCCIALGTTVLLYAAPTDYLPGVSYSRSWQPVLDRPDVPPPAPPDF